jgi:transposase
MAGLAIRDELGAAELRALARREANPRAASRMYAIANALEGMSRAEAARLAGMERQALRDAVTRYNAEGVRGLYDRPKSGRPPRLDAAEQAALGELVLDGPDPEADGLSSWTLPELAREIEARFAKRLHPASLSRVLRRLGFSRQKARPRHPKADEAAKEAFKKGGSPRP